MAKKEIVKKTTKKVEKIEEVAITEPVQSEEVVEVEKPELNYEDLYNESDKSVVVENELKDDKIFQEHVASEISVKKDNNLDELLTMNEEEMVEEAKEKITEKINNERVNQRIDNIFGYLWNGQEMDY